MKSFKGREQAERPCKVTVIADFAQFQARCDTRIRHHRDSIDELVERITSGRCTTGLVQPQREFSKQEKQHMYRAIWNGEVLAESNRTIVVEGNHYFPPDSIFTKFFRISNSHTTCYWKGMASYYDVQVNGEVNKDAAWYYPAPKEAARQIKDYVAFWHGVKVLKVIEEQADKTLGS
jgi:uncharacterized protein (DUF427 family)